MSSAFGSQAASDKTKAAGQTVADSAAQGTKTVQDAVKPYTDAAADHTKAGAHLAYQTKNCCELINY